MQKDADAYRTISEVAQDLGLPSHVLRFWETKFPQIKPLKRGGGRRYYRPQDADLLRGIRGLLHDDGYTIRGVQRLLKDQGPAAIVLLARASPREARCDEREADRPAGYELAVAAGHGIEKPAPDPAPPDDEPRGQTHVSVLRSLLEEIELCREALAAASLE